MRGGGGVCCFPGYASNLGHFNKAQKFPFVLFIVKLTLNIVRKSGYIWLLPVYEQHGAEGREGAERPRLVIARTRPIFADLFAARLLCVVFFCSCVSSARPHLPSPPAASPSWWTFWCWCSSPSSASSSSPTSSTCCEDAAPVRWPAPDVGRITGFYHG